MAVLRGVNGSLKVATNTVAEMNNWSLEVSQDFADTTAFGDTMKESTPTFASWTGSGEGKLDLTDTNGQVALQTAWLGASTVDVRFYVTAASYYHGDAYVSASITAGVDNIVEVSYTFTSAGALTYHAS